MLKTQRKRRSRADACAEILQAAETAVVDTDWNALTVDEVMRRTGMTRSSFYHYFADLDALALGLLEQFAEDIRASVDPWLRGETDDPDPRAATVRHLTAMFEVIHAHRRAANAVAQATGGRPRVYEEWQTRILDYFIDLTRVFIRREIARGRSTADDPDRLAHALILMNHSVANDNLLRAREDDPAAVGRVLAGVWNASIYGASG